MLKSCSLLHKRFSLEEYVRGGKFKMAENFLDPFSPPVYIANYMWELKDKPEYTDRINITEIFYLINIDPSSLMGSELMTKVIPVTNWDNSPYKHIYKSHCYVSDARYNTLLFYDLKQDPFEMNNRYNNPKYTEIIKH